MKFYDAIGYAQSVERPEGSGKYEDIITERMLYGDVLRNTRALEEGDKVNNDRSIGNRFSLMADAYATENFETIRYIKWKGRRYLLRQVEFAPPRLLITPGGVYNGPTPAIAEAPGDSGS
jgi:hypothetical protein